MDDILVLKMFRHCCIMSCLAFVFAKEVSYQRKWIYWLGQNKGKRLSCKYIHLYLPIFLLVFLKSNIYLIYQYPHQWVSLLHPTWLSFTNEFKFDTYPNQIDSLSIVYLLLLSVNFMLISERILSAYEIDHKISMKSYFQMKFAYPRVNR